MKKIIGIIMIVTSFNANAYLNIEDEGGVVRVYNKSASILYSKLEETEGAKKVLYPELPVPNNIPERPLSRIEFKNITCVKFTDNEAYSGMRTNLLKDPIFFQCEIAIVD